MKTLKNKIFAGALTLASIGLIGEKNVNAQIDPLETDTLNKITIRREDLQSKGKKIVGAGYLDNNEAIILFKCYDRDGDGNYEERIIAHKSWEFFKIDYNTWLIDYRLSLNEESLEIVNLKNLTKEQIYQDKKFAERTKRIINACESDEKLREIIKEVYGDSYDDRGHKILIYTPNIKQ